MPPGAPLESLIVVVGFSHGRSQLQGRSLPAGLQDARIIHAERPSAAVQAEAPHALACLLQRAPRLASLTVEAGFQLEVPRCVAERRGLTRLALRYCGLAELPPGPYLAVRVAGGGGAAPGAAGHV